MKRKPKTKAGKKAKIRKVMHEYKTGSLKSSSGDPVKKRKQAVAIAMSESGTPKKKKGRYESEARGARKSRKNLESVTF